MGLFGSSSKKKERKEAMKALKSMEHNRRSSKVVDHRAADPSKAITELQPCGSNLLFLHGDDGGVGSGAISLVFRTGPMSTLVSAATWISRGQRYRDRNHQVRAFC